MKKKKTKRNASKKLPSSNSSRSTQRRASTSWRSSGKARKLNQKLVSCEDAACVLTTLQHTSGALTSRAGGGALSSVNFSTGIHRLARHSVTRPPPVATKQQHQKQLQGKRGSSSPASAVVRASILSDPRFALFLASLAEALASSLTPAPVNNNKECTTPKLQFDFKSRELSNIGWALAKLKLAPPAKAYPVQIHNDEATGDTVANRLEQAASRVRRSVLDVAQERQRLRQEEKQRTKSKSAAQWIPALSQLAGHLLDTISYAVLFSLSGSSPLEGDSFRLQEWANLLWGWATADRAHPAVFSAAVTSMIRGQEQQLAAGDDTLRPQEWSNSLWAFATAQIYQQEGHQALMAFVAHLMDEHPTFAQAFKPQELSNTAWGVATLLSSKNTAAATSASATESVALDPDSISDDSSTGALFITPAEESSALTILRKTATELSERAPEFKTQELGNSAWAMATAGFGISRPGGGESAALSSNNKNNYLVLTSDRADQDRQLMVRAIRALSEAALPKLPRFKSQELNNLAWALARLFSDDDGSNNNDDDDFNDNEFVQETEQAVQQLLHGIALQLCHPKRKVTSQDIGTSLWSMATLDFDEDLNLYRRVGSRLSSNFDVVRSYKPQELSNTVWAMATIEIPLLSEDQRHLFDTTLFDRQQAGRVDFVDSQLDDPVLVCFQLAANEVMRRPYEFKPQEIKDVLWSFSKMQIRNPRLFRFVAQHLVGEGGDELDQDGSHSSYRGLGGFSSQGLGNLAWSFARQAQLADEASQGGAKTAAEGLQFAVPSGRLAVYTASCFDVGEMLIQRLFKTLADTALMNHEHLSKCKPQDIANTAWALAVLGFKHVPFMETVQSEIIRRMLGALGSGGGEGSKSNRKNFITAFTGQELTNSMWALATVNVPGTDEFLRVVEQYMLQAMIGAATDRDIVANVQMIAKAFKRQELANMAWSCAVFGRYPRALMAVLYTGLLGNPYGRRQQDLGSSSDPLRMLEIHKDAGLQTQAIMTLIYVQVAMDRAGTSQGLALPENFPDGWKYLEQQQQSKPLTRKGHGHYHHQHHDVTMMTTIDTFELTLSSSKIQRAVAAAFARIGFDLIEEHVITMEALRIEFDIQIPPKAEVEVLSIDIANVEERIAIEVDGPAHFVNRIDGDRSQQCHGYPKQVNGKLEYQFRWKGDKQEINGPTALKQRLLSALGWKVVHLPFWEWHALGGDLDRQDKYCQNLLEEIE